MVNLSQLSIFLLLQESFSVKIELNRETYSFCELIWFLPLYENPELLSELTGVLSETANEIQTSALLVSLVTATNLNMVQMSAESMQRTYTMDWTHENRISRRFTSGHLERCSLTITTLDHLCSYKHGAMFQGKEFAWYWGNWIHHSLQLVIGLIQVSNVHVMLGVSTKDAREELWPQDQDALDMPPFPTYILRLNASSDILTLGKTQNSVNLPLNINNAGIIMIQPSLKRPMYLLIRPSPFKICQSPRKRHFKLISRYVCDTEEVVPLAELSRIANFTLVVGSLQISSYKAFHGVFRIPNSVWQSSAAYLLGGKFVLEEIQAWRPVYCVNERRWQNVNIIQILFQSLDSWTWMALIVMLCGLFQYLRAIGRRDGGIDAIFEIIMMILQRVARKRDICRTSFLFGLAIIEVLYLSGTTNLIIVPRGHVRPDNVLQLLKEGFKWYQGHWLKRYDRSFVKGFKSDMERGLLPELKNEGFVGNQTDLAKFWLEDVYEADYSTLAELKRRNNQLHKEANIVQLAATSSIANFEPPDITTIALRSLRGKGNCYFMDKLYIKSFVWYYIYSKRRRELATHLETILRTSGIQVFWSRMRKRYWQKVAFRYANEEATIMTLEDIRTVAIFVLLGIGLLASLVVYLLETIRLGVFCNHGNTLYFVKRVATFVLNYLWVLKTKYLGRGALNICKRLHNWNDKNTFRTSERIVVSTISPSPHDVRMFASSE